MITTVTKLRQVLRYVRHFGLRAGLRLRSLQRAGGTVVSFRLPGLAQPLWARAGTSDVATFEEVFVDRQYEVPFGDFSPASILDLGANIGLASVYFAARWPRARILAVEPAASNLALLAKNTERWSAITRLQAAVWSHPAQVRIANPDAAPNAFQMSESDALASGGVAGFTVAELARRQAFERLDLLKMDVEGAEAVIFREDSRWLDRVGVMMVELHDRIVPGCAEALFAALRGRHFQLEIVGSNLAIDLR